MEALLHLGPAAAGSLVSALISAIWEGAVVAGCVFVCLRLLPGLSAAARSAVWMNVFLLLVLLHGLPAVGAHGSAAVSTQHAAFHLNLGWSLGIAAVWVALSLLRGTQLMVSAMRAHGMARRATPVEVDPELRVALRIRGKAKSGYRSAELCTSTEVERPSVFGFFQPRILIPEGLIERLTPLELEQVVLHEMQHLRRGDDWTNLLQKVALVFFPMNPVLLWVERRLCAERELACDDGVLRANGGRKAYATCLTRLAEYSMLRRRFSLVLGAWERQSELVRRVHRILRSPGKTMGARQTAVLTTSLVVGVLGCTLGLSRSPQLVSFDAVGSSTTALLSRPDLSATAVAQNVLATRREGLGTHEQLAKAVMPQRQEASAYRPVQVAANRDHAARAVSLKTTRRRPAATRQAWVLMTGWDDTDFAPSLVLTVARVESAGRQAGMMSQNVRSDPRVSNRSVSDSYGTGDGVAADRPAVNPERVVRPTYAAVPFGNGWLLIQI